MVTATRSALAALLLMVTPALAVGQVLDYSGTYVLTTALDEQMTLTLVQNIDRGVSGTLSGEGVSFRVEATVDADLLNGTLWLDREPLYFEGVLNGPELILRLTADAQGRIGYFRGAELVFTQEIADPYDSGAQARGRDPLDTRNPRGSGNPLAPFSQQGDLGFAGTFTDGALTLELRGGGRTYTGHLTMSGRDYPVTARAADGTLTGSFMNGVNEYTFVATRDAEGIVLESEGQSYYLYYADEFGPEHSRFPESLRRFRRDPYGWTPGISDGSPQAMRWVDYLRNRRLSTLGGPETPYAQLYVDLQLCADGRFLDMRAGSPNPEPGRRRSAQPGGGALDGSWRVFVADGNPVLELEWLQGSREQFWLSQQGATVLLDDSPARVQVSGASCSRR
jgi:hypothetical protein